MGLLSELRRRYERRVMIWMEVLVMSWILRELRAPAWVWILMTLIEMLKLNYKED